MMEVRTEKFEAKDVFNAATAIPLKEVVNQTINVVALWICERPNLEGEVTTVANLKTDDGKIYGTISETVVRSALALPEMLQEQGSIAIRPEFREGSKGREYLVITLV